MGIPIQRRLFLTTLAVLLAGMGLAAGLAWLSVEQVFLENLRDNLLAQAELTAAALQDMPLPTGELEPYSQAANIQPGIHTRLLGEQGGVVVSFPFAADAVQVPAAENMGAVKPDELRQRSEIQSALAGVPSTAVRRVASAGGRRVLYAAAPVYDAAGTVIGIAYLAAPLPASNLPANIILQLLGAVAAAVLLAGAFGAVLSRRIAVPVEDLVRAASAVASGDLNQQVPADESTRELYSLGQAFNRMTANLRQTEQTKNAFIGDVTHELRTPMTVIKGTIETLEDGAWDDIEGRSGLLASMQRETDRLIHLVNDLLVLTRADAGALHLKTVRVDLAEAARKRCEHLRHLAAPKEVRLEVSALGRTTVCGDPDRLTQVLDNLLDNAIRYAPKNTTISVTVEPDGEVVRCAVSDQGVGIAEEHLPYLFERFYRVEAARDRHSGGSGLGLAIVRSLVRAQGGDVRVESAAGDGTTIVFWLPLDEDCPVTD